MHRPWFPKAFCGVLMNNIYIYRSCWISLYLFIYLFIIIIIRVQLLLVSSPRAAHLTGWVICCCVILHYWCNSGICTRTFWWISILEDKSLIFEYAFFNVIYCFLT